KGRERASTPIEYCKTDFNIWCSSEAIWNQPTASLSKTQQTGTSRLAIAATHASAEKPAITKADAEIAATDAMPTWEAAFLTAIYPPRTSEPTISVVSACRGA